MPKPTTTKHLLDAAPKLDEGAEEEAEPAVALPAGTPVAEGIDLVAGDTLCIGHEGALYVAKNGVIRVPIDLFFAGVHEPFGLKPKG